MRTYKGILALLLTALSLCLISCGSREPGVLEGKWAYIHDKETSAFTFKGDQAEFEGKKYTYSVDGGFIRLTRNGESEDLRYIPTEDGMYIYLKTPYERENGTGQEGLLGKWVNREKRWSFEFRENGEFNEDGFFPGHFRLDEEASSFTLMYVDHFEDTVCYYTIEGDVLTVEYPWQLVKMP